MPIEQHPRAYAVLFASTLAFMVWFAVWMMFGVIGIPIRKTLGLNNAEFGLLTRLRYCSVPLMRCRSGIWTDRFGGRIVMTSLLLVFASIPVLSRSAARRNTGSSSRSGLPLGIVGASFAVGTPYCARFFPQDAARLRDGRLRRGTTAPRSTCSSHRG